MTYETFEKLEEAYTDEIKYESRRGNTERVEILKSELKELNENWESMAVQRF